LTQDELAAETGIDSSNIRAYEKGRATPNVFTIVRIADALGVEPGDLLAGITPAMFSPSASDGRRRAG
jgi:transcriptional regulator with XRE-family HTH domain